MGKTRGSSIGDLNLADLVSAIRSELEEIDRARIEAKRAPLFRLASLELELQFVVEKNVASEGKFDIKIVSIGADAGVRSEQVQKVVLKYDVIPPSPKVSVAGFPSIELPEELLGPDKHGVPSGLLAGDHKPDDKSSS